MNQESPSIFKAMLPHHDPHSCAPPTLPPPHSRTTHHSPTTHPHLTRKPTPRPSTQGTAPGPPGEVEHLLGPAALRQHGQRPPAVRHLTGASPSPGSSKIKPRKSGPIKERPCLKARPMGLRNSGPSSGPRRKQVATVAARELTLLYQKESHGCNLRTWHVPGVGCKSRKRGTSRFPTECPKGSTEAACC